MDTLPFEENGEGASALIQYCMTGKSIEIDFGVEDGWLHLLTPQLKEILDIIWKRIQVTPKELIELKKGIFAALDVNPNQKFDDEESSKIVINRLEAQCKWFEKRGIYQSLHSSLPFHS
jgi:hypothetical protein